MKEITVKDKQVVAQKLHEEVLRYLKQGRMSAIVLGKLLKDIRDQELYRLLVAGKDDDYDITFKQYVCLPEISLKPSTANKYIAIWEGLEEYDIKLETVQNVDINKLAMVLKTDDPKKWLKDAMVLAYSDLEKEINEKVYGIKAEDNEVEEFILRTKKTELMVRCPYNPECINFNNETGRCSLRRMNLVMKQERHKK
jgi:hypothetical protein